MKTISINALKLCVIAALLLKTVIIPSESKADLPAPIDLLPDPIALGRASGNMLQSVERIQLMLNQVGSLEAATNTDLADRIRDVKGIVDTVVAAVNQDLSTVNQIVAENEAKLASLEQTIYLDAQRLLDKVQCTIQNAATVQFPEGIAKAIDTFKRSDPSIKVLGIKFVGVDLKEIRITNPDLAYTTTRDGYLKILAHLGENDSAYTIISIYGNIERVAESASCAYSNPTLKWQLRKEAFNYERLAGAWNNMSVLMLTPSEPQN